MQWILQEFQDTKNLAAALDRLGFSYSWHKVVPFVGELIPEPNIADPNAVVMFGSYTLWRKAEASNYRPGVFKLRPFVHEKAWHPYLLNGADALFMVLREIPAVLTDDGRDWFLRPVDDSKELAGKVVPAGKIIEMAEQVLTVDEAEVPDGALRHDTLLMLTEPVRILREWRVWVVADEVVTFSLYREGSRVVYRPEIDDDALDFARQMVEANPDYAPAYVIDICRTEAGLRLLETNCLNSAGFYAADLVKLAVAVDALAKA